MPTSTKNRAKSSQELGDKAKATRKRILQRSIQLFNQHGIHGISTQEVAADLGISPGNFNYYFPRKRDLLEACLDLLQERLHDALTRTGGFGTGLEGAEFLVNVYRTLWDFRFFYNGLTDILTQDATLQKRFMAFNEWAISALEKDCRQFAAEGVMLSEPTPNNYRLLVKNVWAIWLNWLRMQHIISPKAKTPSNEALFECAMGEWSISQPWLTPLYSAALLEGFRVLLLGQAAKS